MAVMYVGTDPRTGAPIYQDPYTGETVTLGSSLYQTANEASPPPAQTGTTAGILSAAGPAYDPGATVSPVDGAPPEVVPYQINTPGAVTGPSGTTQYAPTINPTPSGAIKNIPNAALADGMGAVPVLGDTSVPTGAGAPEAPPPVDPGIPIDSSGGGDFYGSSRSRGRSYGGGRSYGSGGGSSYGGGSSFGDDSDGLANVPAYANGTVHPAVSGEPLTPGGQFNDGSPNYHRGFSKGNIAAYGHGTKRYPSGNFATSLGIAWEDRPQTLAGSLRSSIMDRVNQTAMSGVSGGMAGGTTGAAPSPTVGAGPAMGDTGTMRLRGWAGRQGYTGAGLQSMLSTKPEALLLDVFPGMETSDASFGQLRGLPMNELVMLANGGRRNWTGAPDQQANTLAQMFREVATKPRWLDFHSLLKNLTKAPAKSPLGQLTSAGASPEQNEYYYDTYFNALADATMSDDVALAYKQRAEDLQTEYMNQAAKRGPQRPMPSMATYVGRHIMR